MTFKQILENLGVFFLIALTLAVCISKTAIDVTLCLLILISLCYMVRYAGREYMVRNRFLIVLLVPLAIGFCISFFSMSGPVKGAAIFLERYRFFLLILPFTLFVRSRKSIHLLFVLLNLSAFVSIVYGVCQLNFPNIWARPIGFYPILRQANLLMSIVLINLVGLIGYRMENRAWNITSKILIGTNSLFMMVAVILMLRRSAYLGFAVGVFVFLLLIQKRKVLVLVAIALCVALFFSNSVVVQRVKSIVDFKDDHSNRERIQLLRTGTAYIIDEGLFFHGTGGKMSVEPYTEYFYSHSTEYQAKNRDIVHMNFFGNFHNSFLQMAVEYGLFFLLCYLASIFYLLFRLYRSLPLLTRNQKVYPTATIVATAGFWVSQFFHTNLYSYGALPFLLVFAAGCAVTNWHQGQLPNTASVGRSNAVTEKQ